MRLGYPELFIATFMLMALVSCQTVPPEEELTMASKCEPPGKFPGIYRSYYHTTMAVKNDGGWCWDDLLVTYPGRGGNMHPIKSYDITVSDSPKHGRVVVHDLENNMIRIAYQPHTGFAGKDKFTVHYEVRDTNVVYIVTVSD